MKMVSFIDKDNAEEMLKTELEQELRETEVQKGLYHPCLTSLLQRLARAYEIKGETEKARRQYSRIQEICEKVFVPEYGFRHLISDLFGGSLTRTRPPLLFEPSEEEILMLSPGHHLGTGDNRSTYVHPGNPDLCIKIDKPWNEGFHNSRKKRIKKFLMPWLADFSANREEARFYLGKASLLGEEFYLHAPRCHGVVVTNMGPGLVFERIRDYSNEFSPRLDFFIREAPGKLYEVKLRVEEFKTDLQDLGLYLFAWNAENMVIQACSEDQYRIIAIDWKSESRPNADLPLPELGSYFKRRKMEKEFKRFESWIESIS